MALCELSKRDSSFYAQPFLVQDKVVEDNSSQWSQGILNKTSAISLTLGWTVAQKQVKAN